MLFRQLYEYIYIWIRDTVPTTQTESLFPHTQNVQYRSSLAAMSNLPKMQTQLFLNWIMGMCARVSLQFLPLYMCNFTHIYEYNQRLERGAQRRCQAMSMNIFWGDRDVCNRLSGTLPIPSACMRTYKRGPELIFKFRTLNDDGSISQMDTFDWHF